MSDQRSRSAKARKAKRNLLWLGLAAIAFGITGFVLEDQFGIPFDWTLRIACVATCIGFMVQFAWGMRDARWPWAAVTIALLVDVGIFFTPLVDRPSSRGEIILFALPDAIVFLALWIAFYSANTAHQRKLRMQMAVALILAIAFCALIFGLTLAQVHG